MRYLYILADRDGVWARLRARPMPKWTRGMRICYIGAYEDELQAWEHFRAAQWVAEIAGGLLFPPEAEVCRRRHAVHRAVLTPRPRVGSDRDRSAVARVRRRR
jgi:hypothetical protein